MMCRGFVHNGSWGCVDRSLKTIKLTFSRFIGLTPGVLVTIGVYRWLKGTFSSRKGVKQWARQGQLLLILRYVTGIVAIDQGDQLGWEHAVRVLRADFFRNRS